VVQIESPIRDLGYRVVRLKPSALKLTALSLLERAAAVARRRRLGFLVDALGPYVSRPFERFELEVDGVRLHGRDLAQLHYVRELRDHGRERTFVELLAEAVPDGGVVLEGGAHLGFVSVHAARAAGPNGRVVVFEPNPTVHDILRENLDLNDVADRVDVHGLALGAERGTVRLYLSGDTSSVFEAGGEVTSVEVAVARADEVVEGPVDVVKLDVEGSELAALRGMERLLEREDAPRALFVECHPQLLARAGSSRDELLTWLHAAGYAVEWIDEAGHRLAPLSEAWDGDYVNLRCLRLP